jgi:cyclophilin family peptidyl-prolyl cis-trans isomerase
LSSEAQEALEVSCSERDSDGGRGRQGRGRLFLFALWSVTSVCGFAAAVDTTPPTCSSPEAPHIVLETGEGLISIELFRAAAPEAVDRLIRLVEGPVFHPALTGDHGGVGSAGYYDGLEFDLAFPHTSIATSLRPPADSILIPTRIDAVSLGLDRRRIATAAEASRIWQFELFPHRAGVPSDDQLHPLMRQWLADWSEQLRADFLIGVSQKEINEALGYVYTEGLESQKVTRGAVALAAYDRTRSTPRLEFFLADAPHLDGRRMVVGRVVAGLELVDTLSARPLIPAKAFRNRPMVPTQIVDAEIECRLPTEAAGGPKGAE